LYQFDVPHTPEMTELKPHVSACSRERAKIVELFPRTEITHKNHARPISVNGQNKNYRPVINLMLSFRVETVVLITRVKD
jgi:hypothetical protein